MCAKREFGEGGLWVRRVWQLCTHRGGRHHLKLEWVSTGNMQQSVFEMIVRKIHQETMKID